MLTSCLLYPMAIIVCENGFVSTIDCDLTIDSRPRQHMERQRVQGGAFDGIHRRWIRVMWVNRFSWVASSVESVCHD